MLPIKQNSWFVPVLYRHVVEGAESPVALLAGQPPVQMVVSDVGLPDGDGCELLERLRAFYGGRDLPAIAMSGLGDAALVERCRRAGYRLFLMKPLTFEQLVSDTDDGIFMQTNRSWSIDDKRYNFQFGCEIGWEIKGGKLGRMFKNPSYSGITTEFWNSMDAICSRDQWTLWGTPNCGKGQPMQTMGTGHGAAPARFKNVKIGTAYKGN